MQAQTACTATDHRQCSCLPCLQAMVATVEAYAADEAAQRIIPAVAPLGVDPVSEVRQSALAALDAFMRLLKEHSKQLESATTATGSAAGDAAQVTLPRLSRLGQLFAGNPGADGLHRVKLLRVRQDHCAAMTDPRSRSALG